MSSRRIKKPMTQEERNFFAGFVAVPVVNDGDEVCIVGSHPHEGCAGIFRKDKRVMGDMYLVEFPDMCEHGTHSAYARADQIQRNKRRSRA